MLFRLSRVADFRLCSVVKEFTKAPKSMLILVSLVSARFLPRRRTDADANGLSSARRRCRPQP
jgi:hypothetical protein